MPIPSQNFTIRDPGLGITPEAITTPLYVGCSSIGDVDALYSFSNKGDVIDTLGQGPLPEALCHALDIAGGPVLGMRLTGGTVGVAGAATKTPVAGGTGSGTVTVAGAPYDAYEVIVEIMATGTVGTGRFRYSLDDGRTYSEVLTIPAGGTYAIPNTNLTLTFVPGVGPVFFEDGDLHSFDCTAPLYSTANLSSGITALLADPTEFAFLVLTGEHASGADAATMFAALATHLTSLQNQFRYVGAIMDAGTDTTGNVITAFAAQAGARICVCYGDADMASSKAFAGWGTPKLPSLVTVAARAAASLISTDLARFADGALPGLVSISHDEFRTEVLDQHKITTLRTWQGAQGFYITNARLKSSAGSDFLYWQHRRAMDAACDTVHKAQQPFMSAGVRTGNGGTIDERDATRFEQKVKSALRDRLLSPSNAEGSPGHVSRLDYKIDRSNNVQTSFEVLSKVAIQPLGYVKTLTTEIGFAIIGGE